MPLSEQKIVAFRKELIAWFRRFGRDLPWRHTSDPYAILVSEIMLQQTQVATVVGYFERWMKRFPTTAALAQAGEAEVLQYWQGLGYYSRARNLHAAARRVEEVHGGRFPATEAEIRALPGVGEYTAAAVATFAFDHPTPPLDGNIIRVLARLLDFREPVDTSGARKRLREIATAWQPGKGAGVFNEALMELGALVCTPRAPQCPTCPVRHYCAAETPGKLPVKKPRPKTVRLTEKCAWLVRCGPDGEPEICLEQQTGKRWRGLWKLPLLEENNSHPKEPLLQLEYPFTHHRITLQVYSMERNILRNTCAWFSWRALPAMTAPHLRAARELLEKFSFVQK